jgi:hypothetical protein
LLPGRSAALGLPGEGSRGRGSHSLHASVSRTPVLSHDAGAVVVLRQVGVVGTALCRVPDYAEFGGWEGRVAGVMGCEWA